LRSAESNITDTQAPLQRNANQALAELQRAAQALRVLADFLQRHPESIVRGKPDRPLPPAGDKK
jgi:paraquat-inducible protein B